MYRIALITIDRTLASIFDLVLQRLDTELIVTTPDCDFHEMTVDLLLWHDRDAITCVPAALARVGVPVMNLSSSKQSQSWRLGQSHPAGYQVADYYLVYPFDSEDVMLIFRYWLERSRKRQQS
jgi:hypothetical protein